MNYIKNCGFLIAMLVYWRVDTVCIYIYVYIYITGVHGVEMSIINSYTMQLDHCAYCLVLFKQEK